MADFINSTKKETKTNPQESGETLIQEQEPQKAEGEAAKEIRPDNKYQTPEARESQKAEQEDTAEQAEKESAGKAVKLYERMQATPHTKSERLREVEKELSKEISETYNLLSDEDKQKVREEGEKTAKEIEKLIEDNAGGEKDISRDLLELIRDWMREIPGVNKYFLEQESKRKTDRIMVLVKSAEKELSDSQKDENQTYQKAA